MNYNDSLRASRISFPSYVPSDQDLCVCGAGFGEFTFSTLRPWCNILSIWLSALGLLMCLKFADGALNLLVYQPRKLRISLDYNVTVNYLLEGAHDGYHGHPFPGNQSHLYSIMAGPLWESPRLIWLQSKTISWSDNMSGNRCDQVKGGKGRVTSACIHRSRISADQGKPPAHWKVFYLTDTP